MNKKITLISKKPIVIQIFKLVCNKLNINLDVLSHATIDEKVDIIILDSDFINEQFNTLKAKAKLMGAISKYELPFGIANDFIIPIPFLPSMLEEILIKQYETIRERDNTKVYATSINQNETYNNEEDEDIDEVDASLDFIDNLDSDLSDMQDESIVKLDEQQDGGILDANQLSEIGNILDTQLNIQDQTDESDKEGALGDESWQDLSDIIDQAINEVNTIGELAYDANGVINMKLNDYQLEQLTPLLNLLDQDVIDSLTQGKEVKLNLRFDNEDKNENE